MSKKIKIVFSCFAVSVLFSGCFTTDKKTVTKDDASVGKVHKTPFPDSSIADIKKKNESAKKGQTLKEPVKTASEKKKVKPEKKSVKGPVIPPKTLNRCLPRQEASPFLKQDSFVMCWRISGPYPMSASVVKAQGQSIIHHEFVPQEKKLTDHNSVPGGIKWKVLPAPVKGPRGKVDLQNYWKKSTGPAAAYAATSLYCPVEMKNLTLKTGSSDYIKIWINGKLEQTFNRKKRTGKFDQDSVKGINLRKGINHIVVKTLCFKAPWQFYLRFADAKGMPISILPTIAR